MYYTLDKSLFRQVGMGKRRALVVFYIILGLLIGASAGLYVASKTLPLPNVTNNNFYRSP